MNINHLTVPTLLIGLALFWAMARWFVWPKAPVARGLVAVGIPIFAAPGLMIDLYYTHPYPSIAGLGVGRAGHFVAVLDKTPAGCIVGNPLDGIEIVQQRDILDYAFSGFFLVVSRPYSQRTG